MKNNVLVLVIFSVFTINFCQSQNSYLKENSSTPPNIILILADDMGWSDLGCYGGEIPTPNIDNLASNGLRFRQFYNNSVCGPTRCSLLTGMYAQRLGQSGRDWNQPINFNHSIAISEGLRLAGYHTMMVGKWQGEDLPSDRGFDRSFGPESKGKISYYEAVPDNQYFLDGDSIELPNDFYMTDAFTDYAVEFLRDFHLSEQLKNSPFFLYFAHIAPHWPLHALEEDIWSHRFRYSEMGWDDWRFIRFNKQIKMGLIPANWNMSPRPSNVHAWSDDNFKDWQTERMAVYSAQIASIDKSVGKLLEVLDEFNNIENTLIVFLSDNGAAPDGGVHPSDHGFGFYQDENKNDSAWSKYYKIVGGSGPSNLPGPPNTFSAYGLGWALTSNAPFRSTKMTGYEGGIRTPVIVSWPKFIKTKNRIIDDIGHVFDFLPTFLELAGIEYPGTFQSRMLYPLDGRSLVPVFLEEKIENPDYYAFQVPENRVLISGDWKIISDYNSNVWELYNLQTDGGETSNLANIYPDTLAELIIKWKEWSDYVSLSD